MKNCLTFEDILDIDQIYNLFSAIGLKIINEREIYNFCNMYCMYVYLIIDTWSFVFVD